MLRPRFAVLMLCSLMLGGSFHFSADAGDADAGEYQDRRKEGRCLCHTGKASYEYLRAPFSAPEDPPHCGLMRAKGNCADQPRPKGTSADCWGSTKRPCFWKRHAGSWDITCTLCLADDKCAHCDESIKHMDKRKSEMAKQHVLEKKFFGEDVVIARSPHFYVVTAADKKIKLLTNRGTKRVMTAHEVVHLYAQRCELAYDDFVHWFGGELDHMNKPMAVYVVDSQRDFNKVGEHYFGRHGIHMNYAFAYNDRISGGYCGNGFVVSQQRETNESRMHMFARHQVGHILFSCWVLNNGFESHCPRWAWIGAAHFLAKLLSIHQKYATFCVGEEHGGIGPENRWPRRVKAMAKKPMPPIETFFGLNSLGVFKYHDHLRAWSIMDLCLREDRTRWIQLLKMLRNQSQEGEAFKTALGVTPEQFDTMWRERIAGKRETMGEVRDDPKADDVQAGSQERIRLLQAKKPDVIAGRIQGLDIVKDIKSMELVLPFLGHESDHVRETTHLLLLRTKDPALIRWLHTEGVRTSKGLVRAGVMRVLGALLRRDARDALNTGLTDRHWLVRANAAWALQKVGARASHTNLLAAMNEKNTKAWISIADALASVEGPETSASAALVAKLNHKQWQVRLTAVRGLARCGTTDAIDPLIERFDEESGRVRKELYATLKTLTNDDLGLKASSWRVWWKEQKARLAQGLPAAPPDLTKPKDDRYGPPDREDEPPHYYGRRLFSKSVAFVMDVSDSMKLTMLVDPASAKKLGDIPKSGTRLHIAQQSLIKSLKALDPRTEFDVIFFHTRVTPWRQRLVKANKGTVNSAIDAILRERPVGETNFYGALKAALGLHAKSSLEPKLDAMPDTVFFVTDGRPTQGEITGMPELTSWFANLNRFAKVTLHVIALGELNVDLPELRHLVASGDGGELIHVKEKGNH